MIKTPQTVLKARQRPLEGLTVAEVSHSPAAAVAGLVLAELGASVWSLTEKDLNCGRCMLPNDAAALHDVGKQHLTPQAARDKTFDVLLDDSDLCLAAETGGPEWVRYGTHVEITAFATPQDGTPRRRGTPYTAEAASGVAVALGDADGSPLRLPSGVSESLAGLNATVALLAIVYKTGINGLTDHRIEVSLASCLEELVGINNKMFEGYPREWRREGRRSAGSSGPYPLAIFDAADGLIGLVGRSRSDWECVLAAMGEPKWAQSEEYRDPFNVALHHADEVDVYVGAWLRKQTIAEIFEKSQEFGFVAAPVPTLAEAMDEPQLTHRCFWRRDESESISAMELPFQRFVSSARNPTTHEAGQPATPDVPVETSRLLEGVRVLDFTWVWSGPMATGILASLGAEVIKVEHPGRFDGARVRGRPTEPDGTLREGPEWEVTGYFHQTGAGKLSLGANLRHPEAIEFLQKLARQSDVVVENMRPGTLEAKGLGFVDLSDDHNDLVMLSMSVAGKTGPLSRTRGYATVMSGLAGFESLIGNGPDEVTGGYTFAIADPIAGIFGSISLIASLIGRNRGQGGAFLDLSQLEGILNTLRVPVARELAGHSARPEGPADRRLAGQFVTQSSRDGDWVALSFGTSATLREFASVVEQSRDGAALQPGNGPDLANAIGEWGRTKTTSEIVQVVEATGGMAAPVIAWKDDVVRRAYLGDEPSVVLEHPFGGGERIFTPSWRLNGSRPRLSRRAPLLGEHTHSLLRKVGWTVTTEDAFHFGAVTSGPSSTMTTN